MKNRSRQNIIKTHYIARSKNGNIKCSIDSHILITSSLTEILESRLFNLGSTMKELINEKLQTLETERDEFVALTNKLMDLMTDFCLLSLKAVSNMKKGSLNNQQIDDVINFDLQFRIQQINDPELLDAVRERAHSEFLEILYKYKNPRVENGNSVIDPEISKHT